MKLQRDFFQQDTLIVAQGLIGTELYFHNKKGVITETEAYIGTDDPASHARFGITKRNTPMFGQAGYTYVYMIYGMYYCLNVVTEAEGFPAAVLIRGIIADQHYNGPGKLCRYYNITTDHNRVDIISNNDFFFYTTIQKPHFICTPRIGIKHGLDKLWRFVVSKPSEIIS